MLWCSDGTERDVRMALEQESVWGILGTSVEVTEERKRKANSGRANP